MQSIVRTDREQPAAPECEAHEPAPEADAAEPTAAPRLIDPQERRRILENWVTTSSHPELLRDELLHEIFEVQADSRASATALICGAERVSYGELDRRANRLARLLHSRGVRAGDRVAMLLPRSADVYVTLLAILKSGAAYVPLDPEYPTDRITFILADAGVHAIVTTSDFALRHALAERVAICIDRENDPIAAQSATRLTRDQTGARPENLCYVIYTSGSTGRPKGVQIEHHSACHLVRAEGSIFSVRPEDRVYQGFSIAFDASVEEIWLALAHGAALVVGTPEMVRSGPALSRLLADAGVTVLSCVPTLLSMMPDTIETLRLLIVGGEACPRDLVRRWCKPGLRMVNTYGPTEATVIATWGDLDPAHPVTIGRPVANYRVYLLDSDRQMVPANQMGEIYIGGPGVARGYVGRPDLDAERFIPDPVDSGRLYRTGDLGRYTADGQIEFLGRVDSQVKLRGFRIELEEIESALMQCPGVLAAAATVREDMPGTQMLVAYLIARQGAGVEEESIRRHVRTLLPAYMIPSLLETVTEFPTLPSGKVDRKRLPRPRARQAMSKSKGRAPATPDETRLLAAWEKLFAPAPVAVTDDFFKELGGHSLLAAKLVSELRSDAGLESLSVTDIYNYPNIESLAAEMAARRQNPGLPSDDANRCGARSTQAGSSTFCGLAQLPGLYLLWGLNSIQWLGPYLLYGVLIERGTSVSMALAGALALLLGFFPVMLALPVAAKWLLLGRIRAGSHRLWGGFYVRWWMVHQLLSAAPVELLVGTPLLNLYLRLLGAKIGKHVYLGTDNIAAFDLLTIGDESSIGYDANLLGCTVSDGMLHIGPVTIGDHCFVGARAIIREYARMEDGSSLGDLSMLPAGGRIPRRQKWVGSPARPLQRRTGEAEENMQPDVAPIQTRAVFGLLHAVGVLLLPLVYLVAIFPGLLLLFWASHHFGLPGVLLASPAAAACFIVCVCLEIVSVKWLLLGRLQAGRYPLQSSFYLRKWFFDRLMDSSMDVLGPLYATLYLTPWYRLLGVRLGKGAEVSTACGVTPDLTQVDDESFIADAVCLGAPRVEAGMMTLAPTRVGRRSFVGNSALVPAGATLGESTLVGVLSTTPLSRPGASEPDTSWLGSPAIYLPKRHVNTSFSQETTFKPTRKLIAQRLAIELARVLLPATFTVTIAAALLEVAGAIRPHLSLPSFLSLFPLLYLAGGITGAMMVAAIKWLLMGRYRPDEKPLWSPFVWRTELVTALHEHLADPLLIESLAGTPFICWFFRLMGCRIGRRVFMETTALTEFDLITIGDDVALNLDSTLQTHLFEDRVMKMSSVTIGAGCSVGAGSVVLYDSVMHAGSRLGDLSLLMKGETLPARTSWEGTPARPAGCPHPQRTTAPRAPESSRSFVHLITPEEVRGHAA